MRQLNDWLTAYQKYTENTEPIPLYHSWCGISGIAAALQRRCYLDLTREIIYPNLYIVLVGPPGRSRKSTAIGYVRNLLEQHNQGIALAPDCITKEALVQKLGNSAQTYQDAQGKIVTHSSLTIISSELTVFLKHNDLVMLDTLNHWYDCPPVWSASTVHRNADEVVGPCVNILGGTTPKLILSALPSESVGGGFTSRVIFVYSNTSGIVPYPFLTRDEQELKAKLIYDLGEILTLSGRFTQTAEFLDVYGEWYIAFRQQNQPLLDDENFDGYYSRKAATLQKLSIIMSASRSSSMEVTADDFTRALHILDATEEGMQFALSGVGRSSFAEVQQRMMRDIALRKNVTIEYLMRRYLRDVTHSELLQIIQSLDAAGFCEYIQNTGRLEFNPEWDKKKND
jgi:Protein of unknown function (DUF3987)